MDADGNRQAANVCRWLLTSRLEFIEDRNRYPIADEVIDEPMFVTGEPRSGTTLMHALMSVDPHARALRFWEVMYPSPPPGLASRGDDRRGAGRRRLARDQRQDAQVAAQPPLQRHAGRRSARRRAHLGVRFPRDDAHRLVARPDAVAGRRSAHRRGGAISAAQGHAATAAIPPAAKALGTQGLSRVPAQGDSSTPTPTPGWSGCTATRYRSPRRAP